MNIITIVGARPQFIKSGPVSRALEARSIKETLVHTGQHYDLNMSDVFFNTLGLSVPDHHLGVGSGGHGAQTGAMLEAIERILLESRPDALLVYGDTNSTLAGALAAAKLHIPVIHIEAGLRSFNRQMPEEINRVMTDHVSELLFCPTVKAVDHLASEGIIGGVHMVGDVMKDALDFWSHHNSPEGGTRILEDFSIGTNEYFLATVHRAENVDNLVRLHGIFEAFGHLQFPVILPLHPRTRKALAGSDFDVPENIRLVEPVGYLEMLELESGATALLTDSGGVQKEAYMLGVPCITLRDETEWVETVDAGWNTLVGANHDKIVVAAASVNRNRERPELYGDGRASERIVDITIKHIQQNG